MKTNPNEQAAREFWIDGNPEIQTQNRNKYDAYNLDPRPVVLRPRELVFHVIEHTAYLSALKRAEVAEAKVLAFEGMTFSENQELAVLRAKLAKCEKLFHMLRVNMDFDGLTDEQWDEVSNYALGVSDAITAETLKKGE